MPRPPPIYMDHHATTPVDPRVLEEMLPYFRERFGNAHSRSHGFGWDAEDAVSTARSRVAALIGARSSKEIVFTSGATESDNLALRGAAMAARERGDHLVAPRTEHKAVIDPLRRLEREGFRVTWLEVGPDGCVDPEDVRRAIEDRTIIVSMMLANNEVGTVGPVTEVGAVTRERGVLLHCDAAQGLGLVDFDVERMNVDLVSLSAHKMYGPKGVGALYVRRSGPRVRVLAQMDGGAQERGMRPGTLNVPGIVGLGAAAELMRTEGSALARHERTLRDRLEERLFAGLDGITLNGARGEQRHPGNLNVSVEDVDVGALLIGLKDVVAISTGSACSSASVQPSYVLRAMGIDEDRAHGSLRFGIGRDNTAEDIERVADAVIELAERLRASGAG